LVGEMSLVGPDQNVNTISIKSKKKHLIIHTFKKSGQE
jgi:hypothetical protein